MSNFHPIRLTHGKPSEYTFTMFKTEIKQSEEYWQSRACGQMLPIKTLGNV